jgi:hypothetical protein|nr:MAG TPA: hypothetical protein [Caudoviricetes sp.]
MKKKTVKMICTFNLIVLLGAIISIVIAITTKEHKWYDIVWSLLFISESLRNIVLQNQLDEVTKKTNTT